MSGSSAGLVCFSVGEEVELKGGRFKVVYIHTKKNRITLEGIAKEKGKRKMERSLYLTDEQYLELLKRIRKDLDKIESIFVEDSTVNVGLCAGVLSKSGNWYKDKYVTLETALWPEAFKKIGKVQCENPQMFKMKYRGDGHSCPLDERKGATDGCFYHCRAFKNRKLGVEEVKRLYDERIREVDDEFRKDKRT